MPFDDEVGRMDAVALADKIRAGELSPVDVTEAALRRMERLEPQLHAFCTPTPDLALAAAKQVEKDIRAGREVGPLAGPRGNQRCGAGGDLRFGAETAGAADGG